MKSSPTKGGPAPCIGLRISRRASGEPYLCGIAGEEFTVPRGARVQLRRIRDDGDHVTHAIVFAPPDARVSTKTIEKAVADSAWWRRDQRHDGEEMP